MKSRPDRAQRNAPMAALAAMGLLSLLASVNLLMPVSADQAPAATNTTTEVDAHTGAAAGAHGDADPHQYLGPDQHLKVAVQHYQEGRVEMALETLDMALENFPNHVELLGSRAGIKIQLDQVADALKDLERAIELSPDNPSLLVSRAAAYRRFERTDEAYVDLDRAIEIDTDFLPARFNRGSMRLADGKPELAIEDFNRCIAIDPHLAAPWFNRASAYQELGDTPAAIDDMKRFLNISDNPGWNATARNLLSEWGEVNIPAAARASEGS